MLPAASRLWRNWTRTASAFGRIRGKRHEQVHAAARVLFTRGAADCLCRIRSRRAGLHRSPAWSETDLRGSDAAESSAATSERILESSHGYLEAEMKMAEHLRGMHTTMAGHHTR